MLLLLEEDNTCLPRKQLSVLPFCLFLCLSVCPALRDDVERHVLLLSIWPVTDFVILGLLLTHKSSAYLFIDLCLQLEVPFSGLHLDDCFQFKLLVTVTNEFAIIIIIIVIIIVTIIIIIIFIITIINCSM